jgi:hypothetical protein
VARVALLGSATGIGAAGARVLREKGHELVLGDVNAAALEEPRTRARSQRRSCSTPLSPKRSAGSWTRQPPSSAASTPPGRTRRADRGHRRDRHRSRSSTARGRSTCGRMPFSAARLSATCGTQAAVQSSSPLPTRLCCPKPECCPTR